MVVWVSEGPEASKLTKFQINTKSISANIMNISIESLSLIGYGFWGNTFKEFFICSMAISLAYVNAGASVYFGHVSS